MPTRRTSTELNPFLGGAINCENASVRQLARLFNTEGPHSRRALLKWAAVFAGVSQEEANLLGRPIGEFIVSESARGTAARTKAAASNRRFLARYDAAQHRADAATRRAAGQNGCAR